MQTMRIASALCVAGWLAIYFAEVCPYPIYKPYHTWRSISRIRTSSLINSLFCLILSKLGSTCSGYRKIGHGIWNGSLFLCGNSSLRTTQIWCSKLFYDNMLDSIHSDDMRLSLQFRLVNLFLICVQVPIFIAEITPKNLRGALTAVNQAKILYEHSRLKLQAWSYWQKALACSKFCPLASARWCIYVHPTEPTTPNMFSSLHSLWSLLECPFPS